MATRVSKAVIPVAGLGTRFLPATKTVPKEMLTIVDAPILLYVVEEALAAGIQDIVLIAGRGKHAIEDFFDTSYELEDRLHRAGKTNLLQRLIQVRESANIISIRQKAPLGLGHAVLCAQPVIGNEPFAVLLGDEVMSKNDSNSPLAIEVLCKTFEKTGKTTVAIMPVEDEDVSRYGIADISAKSELGPTGEKIFRVQNFVEKPSLKDAPSRWALPGRYVFDHQIFDWLRKATPGVGGEIQLTDAMSQLCAHDSVWASTFSSTRHDAGDKLGYLMANIEFGLMDPDLGPQLQKYLLKKAKTLL